jgi:hypothetical protein
MTIPDWNLILNATILVAMVGYGVWLNHITKQQDRLKSNTVESLNAVIASKDAEIARLKGETAPEIARSYKAMKDYAEEISKKTSSLEQDLERLRQEIGEKEGLLSVNYVSGEADGYLQAAVMLVKAEESVAAKATTAESIDIFRAFSEVVRNLLVEAQTTNDRARALVRPKDSNS